MAVLKGRALKRESVPRSKQTAPSLGPKGGIAQKCRACICWGRLVLGEEAMEQTWRGCEAIATASADSVTAASLSYPSLNLRVGKKTAG